MSRRWAIHAIPPPLLVLGGIASTQFGASLAKGLFDDVGPSGTVLLRTLFAALVLALLWRPSIRQHSARALVLVCAFGVSLAAMNLSFYEAIDRIPLGVAVTLEFAGPLTVAVMGSRRALDLLWVTLAAAGILLLADLGGGSIDALGAALALVAGVFWGTYILLSERVGRVFPSGSGLALAMLLSAALLLPVGVVGAGSALLDVHVLAVGALVAVMSSALPYSLELEALRRLPSGVFGVLMSIEPAMAALAGLVVLGQGLSTRQAIAIALVVVASAGATRRAAREAMPRD